MRFTKRKLIVPLLLASAMLASACGSDSKSSSATNAPGGALSGTLRVLVHQNPPMVTFMEKFNKDFEAANPGVKIDMSIVNANDLPTVNQTRLTANDIDVTTVTVTGFANPVQPYMTDADAPYWQQLIKAGLLMDLTNEPFVQNFDKKAVDEGGSFEGKVYSINLGRTTYSGMFVNLDLLEKDGVAVPTTWDELVAACDAVKAAGDKCMIAGGADGWPVFVGSYGLLGALYPDQQGLVEGLWTGKAKWNDEQGLKLFERYKMYSDMLDPESAGLGGDAAAQRFLAGDVAFGPMGGWNAGILEPAADSGQTGAEFQWTYIPFPGSDDAADNQTLFGKYDQGLAIAADTPVKDLALAYLTAFSAPDSYNAFANAVNLLPSQPTATLDNTMGRSVAPILQAGKFTVGYEQWFVGPTGAGQYANGGQGSLWFYNGEFSDPADAANKAQSDLESGL